MSRRAISVADNQDKCYCFILHSRDLRKMQGGDFIIDKCSSTQNEPKILYIWHHLIWNHGRDWRNVCWATTTKRRPAPSPVRWRRNFCRQSMFLQSLLLFQIRWCQVYNIFGSFWVELHCSSIKSHTSKNLSYLMTMPLRLPTKVAEFIRFHFSGFQASGFPLSFNEKCWIICTFQYGRG